MGVPVFKKGFFSSIFSGVRLVVFTLVLLVVIVVAVSQAAEANRAEGIRLLEDAIVRAAVHSYAVNGFFPASLDYIEQNFGIHIDHSRFVVHYDVFASNILPDIRVFELR
jgi:hypothetical protein